MTKTAAKKTVKPAKKSETQSSIVYKEFDVKNWQTMAFTYDQSKAKLNYKKSLLSAMEKDIPILREILYFLLGQQWRADRDFTERHIECMRDAIQSVDSEANKLRAEIKTLQAEYDAKQKPAKKTRK